MENSLKNLKVAVLATDGFEESELTEPVKALKEAGADVEVISLKAGSIQGLHHYEKAVQIPVDRVLSEANPSDYQAVVLPGGAMNADALRSVPEVQRFIQAFKDKPMAVICHAPWILVSAGLAKGRKLTSYHTIRDDITNAGGQWSNAEVIVDRNLVTSRQPSDLPAFNREMIKLFASSAESKAA